MVTGSVSLLLVARPGRMREGLQALLRTIHGIEIVGQADYGLQVLTLISQKQPALLLLDSSLDLREMLSILVQIKGTYPEIRCIVLVENAQQQSEAKEAGSNRVLITGFNAEILKNVINELVVRINDSTLSEEEIWHD